MDTNDSTNSDGHEETVSYHRFKANMDKKNKGITLVKAEYRDKNRRIRELVEENSENKRYIQELENEEKEDKRRIQDLKAQVAASEAEKGED